MGIQYSYAMLTMLPCPLWFWYRWASAGFLMVVFTWASWNGATYYIDVFGRRMEKELEGLRKEVQRMAQDGVASPMGSPPGPEGKDGVRASALDLGPSATQGQDWEVIRRSRSEEEVLSDGLTVKKNEGMVNETNCSMDE